MRCKNYISLSICLSILFCLAFGCQSGSRVSGRVFDSEGIPIDHADIVFETIKKTKSDDAQARVTTDSAGNFNCSVMHASFSGVRLKLTVSKKGYKTYETTFEEKETQGNEGKDLRITLEKDNSLN